MKRDRREEDHKIENSNFSRGQILGSGADDTIQLCPDADTFYYIKNVSTIVQFLFKNTAKMILNLNVSAFGAVIDLSSSQFHFTSSARIGSWTCKEALTTSEHSHKETGLDFFVSSCWPTRDRI